MHSLSSITLSFKAHVLRRSSARVALAAGSHDGGRFHRAMNSIQNSEDRLSGRFWSGALSAPKLVDRAAHLARLREQLIPSHHVADRIERLEQVLNRCGDRRPRWVSNTGPRAQAMQALVAPDAVLGRARAALAALFWQGELTTLADFQAAYQRANPPDSNDPDRAADLHRAAMEQLYAQAPAVEHGGQKALLFSFGALVAPQHRPSVVSLSPSRASRNDAVNRWRNTAMLADASAGSDSDEVSDDGSCSTASTAWVAIGEPRESYA